MRRSFTTHRTIFKRLEDAGLKMGRKKCFFALKELEFLGHRISRKGRPVETARFKGPLEASTKSNIIGSNKCSLCSNMGHNHATCPSNPDRKKRKL